MKISRTAAILFAMGSLAALPACSMFGGESGGGGGMFGGGNTAAATTPAPTYGQPGLSPSMVKQVQTALKQQGIYKGNVDGVWGDATRMSVRNYQQQHNLTVNGELDPQTLQALNIPNTGMNSNTAGGTGSNAPGSANPPAVSGGGMPNNPPANQTNP